MTQEIWIDFSYSKPQSDRRIKVKISETCIFFAIYRGYGILECIEGSEPIKLHLERDFDIEARKNMQWSEIRV